MTATLSTFETPTTLFNIQAGDVVGVPHAHPDDEALVSGAVQKAIQLGAYIVPILATQGEQSDRGDAEFLASGGRLQEGVEAWRAYGVPAERIVYFGLKDGQLHERFARRRLENCIGETIATHLITTLITTGEAGQDGHPDHIAIHEAALVAAAAQSSRHRRKMVNVWGLSATDYDVAVPTGLNDKLGKIRHHTSQFGIVEATPGSTPSDGWLRMGAYYVREDSADQLAQYAENFSSQETYKLYTPGWGY